VCERRSVHPCNTMPGEPCRLCHRTPQPMNQAFQSYIPKSAEGGCDSVYCCISSKLHTPRIRGRISQFHAKRLI
jgi:hypothetical protein